MTLKTKSWLLVSLALITMLAAMAQASTLDTVKEKGFVQCGVSQGLPGFSNPNEKGDWTGLDVDFCRALALAIFNDKNKVKFTPLSAKERFTALQSGEVDVLSRNTTWTATRDTALGLNFAGVIFYDGQGFLLRKDLGINKATELDGATICTNAGTTTELNLADYFRSHKIKYKPVVFEKYDEVIAAYETGRCDAFTTDRSGLFAQRIKLKKPNDHLILPDVISKEPLGPVVRQGDDQWFNLVKWTLFALINAEELGINSKNVNDTSLHSKPAVKRLLGMDSKFGDNLGVSNDWVKHVIEGVGNYAEIYERNVGEQSPLNIPRGQNSLWTQGGLLYAPPFR